MKPLTNSSNSEEEATVALGVLSGLALPSGMHDYGTALEVDRVS